MKQFLEQVRAAQDGFRPLPFWSWNDELSEERLREQVRQMHSSGLGGFFMHARVGLKTPYMQQQWFNCVKACIEEGEKCGIEPWGYDENGYPSGIADGQVCRESENWRATWIELKPVTGKEQLQNLRVAACYESRDGAWVRCDEAAFSGTGLVAHTKNEMRSADPMSAEAVQRFLELTHERYKKELGADFGRHMKGFFTDEPQLKQYQLPWSHRFEEKFQEAYGYDLLNVLPALKDDSIPGAPAVRHDYWMLVSKLYCGSFAKQVFDWCQENSCEFTGHVMGEDTLLEQMGSCGGVMPFYPHMHMPGMDWLGRRIGTPIAPKQVSSVAAQMGRSRVLSETFALSGWDVSFEDLKWMAQWQMANGITRLCPHLESYSIRGIRKRDYPASLFVQEPWWAEFGAFTDWASALGAVFGLAQDACDVLVLHPLHTAYVRYNGSAKCQGVRQLDGDFAALSERLQQAHIPYHYGDEVIMRDHGSIHGGALQVGQMTYRAVILPKIDNIMASTLTLLEDFAASGGRIYAEGALPALVDGRPSDRALALSVQPLPTNLKKTLGGWADALSVTENGEECPGILTTVRQNGDTTVYFVANMDREQAHTVTVRCGVGAALWQVELPSMERTPCETAFTCTLAPAQSLLLITGEPAQAETGDAPVVTVKLPDTMRIAAASENALTLDACQWAVGDGAWQPEMPLIRLQKLLLDAKTDDTVRLKFKFQLDMEPPQSLTLVSENIPDFALTVNGQAVQAGEEWYLDPDFRRTQIAPYVRRGENIIELVGRFWQRRELYDYLYRPKDLSSNFYAVDFEFESVTYDVELESIYLLGDFCVESSEAYVPGRRRARSTSGTFRLTEPKKELRTGDITTQGYPFFAGTMDVEFTVTLDKKPGLRYILDEPKPDCPAAQLLVNGKDAGMLLWAPGKPDITDLLCSGENKLTLRLYSGLRNLLGPHHYLHGESYYVGVSTFGDLPGWCEDVEGVSGNIWSDDFCFVTFGPHRD